MNTFFRHFLSQKYELLQKNLLISPLIGGSSLQFPCSKATKPLLLHINFLDGIGKNDIKT